jgi:hypothetical protein
MDDKRILDEKVVRYMVEKIANYIDEYGLESFNEQVSEQSDEMIEELLDEYDISEETLLNILEEEELRAAIEKIRKSRDAAIYAAFSGTQKSEPSVAAHHGRSTGSFGDPIGDPIGDPYVGYDTQKSEPSPRYLAKAKTGIAIDRNDPRLLRYDTQKSEPFEPENIRTQHQNPTAEDFFGKENIERLRKEDETRKLTQIGNFINKFSFLFKIENPSVNVENLIEEAVRNKHLHTMSFSDKAKLYSLSAPYELKSRAKYKLLMLIANGKVLYQCQISLFTDEKEYYLGEPFKVYESEFLGDINETIRSCRQQIKNDIDSMRKNSTFLQSSLSKMIEV